MDVRCDRCQTEYELEDHRLTDAGLAVKCTHCGNVFKVRRGTGILANPPAPVLRSAGGALAAATAGSALRIWQVRRRDGKSMTLRDLGELQRAARERRVSPDDAVSLNGGTWQALEDLPELAEAFAQVRREGQRPPSPGPRPAAGAPAARAAPAVAPDLARRVTLPSPASATPRSSPSAAADQPSPSASGLPRNRTPSWDQGPSSLGAPIAAGSPNTEPAWLGSLPSPPDDQLTQIYEKEDLQALRGGAGGRWVAALLAAATLAAATYFVLLPRSTGNSESGVAAAPAAGANGHPAADPATAPVAPAPVAPAGPFPGSGPALAPVVASPLLPHQDRPAAAPPMPTPPAPSPAPAAVVPAAAPELPSPAKSAGPAPAPASAEEIVVPPASGPKGAVAPAAASPGSGPPAAARVGAVARETVGAPAGASGPTNRSFDYYLAQGHKLLDSKPTQALALFEKAADLDPSSPEPDSGRGLAYANLERLGDAAAAFQAALRKSAEFTEAIMGLAEVARQQGKRQMALGLYQRYLSLTPDGPDAPAARAQLDQIKAELAEQPPEAPTSAPTPAAAPSPAPQPALPPAASKPTPPAAEEPAALPLPPPVVVPDSAPAP